MEVLIFCVLIVFSALSIVADGIDYIFLAIYLLAGVAILNNIIHYYKRKKRTGKGSSSDVSLSLLYLLMGIGAAAVKHIWF